MPKFVFVAPTLATPPLNWAVKAAWAHFAPGLHVVTCPHMGTGSCQRSYLLVEAELLTLAADGPIVLSGWSQGAVHALRFAIHHPELVERLVLIAGPFAGTWVWLLTPAVAASLDMRPGSPMLRTLAKDLANMTAPLPETHVLLSAEDGIIDPLAAALPAIVHAVYYVFGTFPPTHLPDYLRAGWIQSVGVNHLTIGFHPTSVAMIARAMCGPPATVLVT